MTPADRIRDHLVSQGLVTSGVTPGSAWVCLIGGLSDALAAPQVAVLDTGGIYPFESHNSTPPTRPGIQLLLRGTPGTYAATASKARAIWSALRAASPTGIMLVTPTTSPIWLGMDDQNRPGWSMNFLTITKET